MSGSLIIVLIIVVWLFVLAPLLLRGQKPIRKAGEAFDDTRVIHEGGSGHLPTRRRPHLSAADVRPVDSGDEAEDYEIVDAHEVLLDDDRPSRPFHGLFTRQDEPAEIVDGGLVHELEAAVEELKVVGEPTVDADEATGATVTDEWEEWDEETTYAYDDSYTSPADFLYPDTVGNQESMSEDVDAEQDNENREEDEKMSDEELSDEEMEFAEHRAGRGGWDPVADAEHSLTRYQRRQRTLLGLAAAVAVTAILAFVVGGWAWLLSGLAVVATVVYLSALRTQVRAEQALRARRIRQLRRARLGVRSSTDEELAVPRHLRRPGAVILERDDESPDFEDLPVTDVPVAEGRRPGHDYNDPYGRRVG
ncbi:divisome protein SepX/GlpR [Corynebacterium comes]|uniref:DUF3329 domain-containing protein n=1 Tax=Corynebacterium comes TaxID=2675218 RepID=A0A6B8WAZ6_9CORY|nr:gephyrin-like molybdotransferase receptor GlpR [Corynebacterium comes]QGU04048.1 hypothetical protein CETAM_03870 [Corynebacterium comes]